MSNYPQYEASLNTTAALFPASITSIKIVIAKAAVLTILASVTLGKIFSAFLL